MDALAAYASSSSGDDTPCPPTRRTPAFAVHVKTPASLDSAATRAAASLAARVTAAVPSAVADARLREATEGGNPDTATLHVSLSRGGALPSLGAATALLDALASLLADAAPFTLSLSGVAVLQGGGGGDENARVFVCIGGSTPDPHFSSFVRRVDDAVALSDLPPFHAVPLPHISVASAPAADTAEVEAAVEEWDVAPLTVCVRSVECRVGNRLHVVWRAEENGLGFTRCNGK